MKSDRRAPVAIIGGGFSGTILAAQLARRGIASVLIDGSGRMGRGVAYSTDEPAHLLNVRAEGMSAWAGEPDHFAKRFEAKAATSAALPSGGYSAAISGRSSTRRWPAGKSEPVDATARARPATETAGGSCSTMASGSRLTRWRLASAIRRPSRCSAFAGVGDRFIRNPWGADARAAVAELAAEGRKRAARRDRPDDGRSGAVARRRRTSRADRRACRGAG